MKYQFRDMVGSQLRNPVWMEPPFSKDLVTKNRTKYGESYLHLCNCIDNWQSYHFIDEGNLYWTKTFNVCRLKEVLCSSSEWERNLRYFVLCPKKRGKSAIFCAPNETKIGKNNICHNSLDQNRKIGCTQDGPFLMLKNFFVHKEWQCFPTRPWPFPINPNIKKKPKDLLSPRLCWGSSFPRSNISGSRFSGILGSNKRNFVGFLWWLMIDCAGLVGFWLLPATKNFMSWFPQQGPLPSVVDALWMLTM